MVTQLVEPTTRVRRRPSWRRLGFRLIGTISVVLGVVTLVFFIGAATGQNAATTRLGPFSSAEARAAFEQANGLDDPIVVQYVRYLGRVLHGDLGTSLVTSQPIGKMVWDALPVTVSLAVLATIVAAIGSLLLGCIAALYRGGWADRLIRAFGSIGQALPVFWLGLIAIQIFAINLHWVPSGGYVPLTQDPGQWFRSMITPVLVLSVPYVSVMSRVVRASMIEQLDQDYVRTARGLGLSTGRIMVKNVLRNGLIAPVTVLGLSLGGLFGGAVFVESVFRLPGLGGLIVTAVAQRDFGIVAAASTVAAIAFVVINLLTDGLQAWLNPRKVGEM